MATKEEATSFCLGSRNSLVFQRVSWYISTFLPLRIYVLTRLPVWTNSSLPLILLALSACAKQAPPAAAPQALPVQTQTITAAAVPQYDEYVSTIKSRRSATIQPQVDGNLTKIYVHSGDHVRAGQVLMEIDPAKQDATVASSKATEQQKLAVFQYNQIEVERQRKLFEQGVSSRGAFDQAEQAYKKSQADYDSAVATTQSQRKQLGYYHIAAPFDGIVGDVPPHLGDYVSPTTLLTTVDENADLEAYIYVPTERATLVRQGLPVEILDSSGKVLVKSTISFLSPQVDNGLQSILAKAEIPRTAQILRNQQLVNARVIWSTSPAPVVPVLAVSLVGGQTFVYLATPKGDGYVAHQVPVTVGETVGNTYPVLAGLKTGEKVITSGLQFLQEGAPVKPLG